MTGAEMIIQSSLTTAHLWQLMLVFLAGIVLAALFVFVVLPLYRWGRSQKRKWFIEKPTHLRWL